MTGFVLAIAAVFRSHGVALRGRCSPASALRQLTPRCLVSQRRATWEYNAFHRGTRGIFNSTGAHGPSRQPRRAGSILMAWWWSIPSRAI